MAMRMKRWLDKICPKGKVDWGYIQRDACWKPIKSYRTVTRGKKKGQIEVTLFVPEGRKRIIPADHFRPREDEQI
jgi:hypothetical protein